MVKKTKKNPEGIQRLKKQSRKYSIKEGIFARAKSYLGYTSITPFAIAINTSNPLVAMLSSISGLLGPLSQLKGSKYIEKYSRKKILLRAISLETLMWLPLITLAILFYKGIYINTLPFLLLFFFALYTIFSNLGDPAWFSWMGDIVDKKGRGKFFSKRNLILGFMSVLFAILAGFLLDYFKLKNITMFGFILLFSLAILMEIFRLKSFKQQYEPKIKLKKGYYFSFWEFLKQAPKNNFGKFSIFRLFFTMANNIATPLITIYLLRQLEFSYALYMTIILSGTFFSLFFLELWGKFTDKYGNYKTLLITTMIIPIIPMLWILNPSPIYLILIPSAISGITWAGFHLAAGNFIYDNVKKQKRGLAISYHNMLFGIGMFLGASISAILIKFIETSWIKPLILIFFISTITRMMVVFLWIPKLKEVRKTAKFEGTKSFENLIMKNGKTILNQEIYQIAHIKDYVFKK